MALKAGPQAKPADGTSIRCERKGAAVVEDLGLCDREDPRTYARGHTRISIAGAGSYDVPGCIDDVRLFVVY